MKVTSYEPRVTICCANTGNFSDADDADNADFKSCTMFIASYPEGQRDPCYPCHLRLKNYLYTEGKIGRGASLLNYHKKQEEKDYGDGRRIH